MALTPERLEALKNYCRIDADEDDRMLRELYTEAEEYLRNAGVGAPEDGTPRRAQYDLCAFALVLDSYDNRGATGPTGVMDNPAFRRRLNQLKLTERTVV